MTLHRNRGDPTADPDPAQLVILEASEVDRVFPAVCDVWPGVTVFSDERHDAGAVDDLYRFLGSD